MTDKLSLIRKILETDEETDRKIWAIIEKKRDQTTDENKIVIEERSSDRKNITVDVILRHDNKQVDAKTGNISATGFFIRTDETISKEEDIEIKLIVPSGEETAFFAKVVRVDEDGIGVVLKTANDENKAKLAQFVSRF